MALDPTALFMPGMGHLYVAPVGTALPETFGETLNVAFKELGFTTKEGVSPKFGKESVEIEAWQSGEPIDERIKKRTTTFDVQLLEMNAVSFPLAIGGATITDDGDDGAVITPFDTSQVDRRSFVLDAIDDDVIFRFVAERVSVSGDVTTKFNREEPNALPLSLKALAPSDLPRPWICYTNAPLFVAAA